MSLFREKLIILLMVSVGSGFEVMPTSCACNNSLMSASHDSPGYSPKINNVECVSSLAACSLFVRPSTGDLSDCPERRPAAWCSHSPS